jgi:hypothetical protein
MMTLAGCSNPTQSATDFTPTTTPQPSKIEFLPTITPIATVKPDTSQIPLPADGQLYHGVYPGGTEKEDVTLEALLKYESTVGKQATWVYFSAYWFETREFPVEISTWIRNEGSIPFIRMMLQSEFKFTGTETVYTPQNILDGKFDSDLLAWCIAARNFGTQILVEYGTEVNTDSFPWSGVWNGGGTLDDYGSPSVPDGPERFRDAYRHIIQICRDTGAENITWVFHPSGESYPDEPWNKFEYYYPGDEWVDWIGVSIYGTHTPMDIYYGIFRPDMDSVHKRILDLAPEKPIIVAEFGTAKNNPFVDQVQWTREALNAITSNQYKNLIGFAWWNEAWQNDSNPDHDTTMRVQDNPELELLFRELVGKNPYVIGEISP